MLPKVAVTRCDREAWQKEHAELIQVQAQLEELELLAALQEEECRLAELEAGRVMDKHEDPLYAAMRSLSGFLARIYMYLWQLQNSEEGLLALRVRTSRYCSL